MSKPQMEHMEEKSTVEMIESLSSNSSENLGYDEKATKRLVRKIDWRLLPFLALLYLLSFLDRTNIGNARLAGIEKSLGMKGLNYNVSIHYYILKKTDFNKPNRPHWQSSSPFTSLLRSLPT